MIEGYTAMQKGPRPINKARRRKFGSLASARASPHASPRDRARKFVLRCFVFAVLGGGSSGQCVGAVAPSSVPLPPRRPSATLGRAPIPPRRSSLDIGNRAPGSANGSPSISQIGSQCATLQASGQVIGTLSAPITGPGGCGIANPIVLSAIILTSGRSVKIKPAAVMGCSLALELATWVRKDVALTVRSSGKHLSVIDDEGAYECRTRNGLPGAKLSEHAKGDAIDLNAMLDAKKESLLTFSQQPGSPLAREIRDSACRRFTTVLGPGSDGYHTSHVHLDLERRHSASICQWKLH